MQSKVTEQSPFPDIGMMEEAIRTKPVSPSVELFCRLLSHELAGILIYNAMSYFPAGLASPSLSELGRDKSIELLKSSNLIFEYICLTGGNEAMSHSSATPCTRYMDLLKSCKTIEQLLPLVLDWNKQGYSFCSELSKQYSDYPEIQNFIFGVAGQYLVGIHKSQVLLA
jgi:hypothetical protein